MLHPEIRKRELEPRLQGHGSEGDCRKGNNTGVAKTGASLDAGGGVR